MKENIMKIPNSNNLLEKELKSNKKKYIDEVYRCIVENVKKDYIHDNIKLFTFDKTDLQVLIKCEHYLTNIENIINYYIKEEEYEKCKKLTNIKSILNKEE